MKKSQLLLMTALSTGLMISSVGQMTQAASTSQFQDVPSEQKEKVQFLYENELFNGISKNEFGWDLPIKRLDATVVIYEVLGPNYYAIGIPPTTFTDVPKRAVTAVSYLQAFNIVNGKTATSFGANDTLIRGEFAIIASAAYDKVLLSSDKATHSFTDASGRYQEAIDRLQASGITKGKSSTKFGTIEKLTRGEFALFIYNLEQLKLTDVNE